MTTPLYEPFGITPVEAMACGTPAIGSNVGGIKFTIADGETGYLVPPNDPDAIAERIAYLYKHPQVRHRLGLQAIQRAHDMFTWKHVASAVSHAYAKVLDIAQWVNSPGEVWQVKSNLQSLSNQSKYKLIETSQLPETRNTREFSNYHLLPSSHSPSLRRIEQNFVAAIAVMEKSRAIAPAIVEVAEAISTCFANGGKVLVCGNGGSAADAQHFAAEFVGKFRCPQRQGLPVMALTADSAFLSAWANDVGYEYVFSRQVETFAQPGDLLLGISTSGRSRNLIEAFKTARQACIKSIALLGGDGGELLAHSDLAVVVPATDTQRIQEVQHIVLHILCELVEEQLKEGRQGEGEQELNVEHWEWDVVNK